MNPHVSQPQGDVVAPWLRTLRAIAAYSEETGDSRPIRYLLEVVLEAEAALALGLGPTPEQLMRKPPWLGPQDAKKRRTKT